MDAPVEPLERNLISCKVEGRYLVYENGSRVKMHRQMYKMIYGAQDRTAVLSMKYFKGDGSKFKYVDEDVPLQMLEALQAHDNYDVVLFGNPVGDDDAPVPVKAHKMILSAASRHLRDAFASVGFRDSSLKEYPIEEVDHVSLQSIVRCVYTGKLSCNSDGRTYVLRKQDSAVHLESILMGADYLVIPKLTEMCESTLVELLAFLDDDADANALINKWLFAKMYRREKLAEAAAQRLRQSFPEFEKAEVFLALSADDRRALLKDIPLSIDKITKKCDQICEAATAWFEFKDVPLQMLEALLADDNYDVVLFGNPVGDGNAPAPIKAHKMILSAASKHFRDAFASVEFRSSNAKEYEVDAVDHLSLQSIVQCVYTGKLSCDFDIDAFEYGKSGAARLESILIGADRLNMPKIVDMCGSALVELLNSDNPGVTINQWLFARMYRCEKLARAAAERLRHSFPKIQEADEFLALSADDVCALVSDIFFASMQADLQLRLRTVEYLRRSAWQRDQICKAAVTWLKYNSSNETAATLESETVMKLFNAIPLSNMSVEALQQLSEEILGENLAVMLKNILDAREQSGISAKRPEQIEECSQKKRGNSCEKQDDELKTDSVAETSKKRRQN